METPTILITFGAVYLGMILGKFPGLALDRTGIALLGAIALLAVGEIDPQHAWFAIDVPTMALLLGLMVVSAQFRLGGFYAQVTRKLGQMEVSPPAFLAVLIGVAAFLSALLANDIICLAMTPVLIEACARRNLDPLPFLLALACASNVGSAATLIGNPQNMLIGQSLQLSFTRYLVDGSVPVLLGLVVIWAVLVRQVRGNWHKTMEVPEVAAPPFDAWHAAKGLLVTTGLVLCFLFTHWPRDVVALGAAGILLTSRHMASRRILGLVDWQLLVLFAGLFIVNHSLQASGLLDEMMHTLRGFGVDLVHPAWLFSITALLSNLVSNVPAVMLLLPAATHPLSGPILALSSTFAGNLFIVGSIANIIVVEQAREHGVSISWLQHARAGIPITLITLVLAALWIWVRANWM